MQQSQTVQKKRKKLKIETLGEEGVALVFKLLVAGNSAQETADKLNKLYPGKQFNRFDVYNFTRRNSELIDEAFRNSESFAEKRAKLILNLANNLADGVIKIVDMEKRLDTSEVDLKTQAHALVGLERERREHVVAAYSLLGGTFTTQKADLPRTANVYQQTIKTVIERLLEEASEAKHRDSSES